jgi:hypothetical protein
LLFVLKSNVRTNLSLLLTLGISIGLTVVPADAGTVTFTYTGSPGPQHSSGTGSFSFSDSPASVALGDLTAFSFLLSVNNGGTNDTFGLGDLLTFTATISGGSVTALSLQTQFVQPTPLISFPEDFVVTGLGANQARNDAKPGTGIVNSVDQGIVTTSGPGLQAAPEPTTLSFLGLGLAAVALAGLRRHS